ncbi:MAG: PepSY domain-containing protein [Herbaspirillum sp.]
MNTFSRKVAIALAISTLSFSALASTYNGSCTNQAKSSWMTQDAMKTQFEKQGYTVGRVKSSGTCYEVYTKAKDGSKVELFVDPTNGNIVGEGGKK